MRLAVAERGAEDRAVPAMANDVVRYVGDAVAVVVAETAYQALRRARAHRGGLRTAAGDDRSGEGRRSPARRSCTRKCPTTSRSTGPSPAATSTPRSRPLTSSSSDRIIQQRLIPTAMEPRAALAQFTPATGELTLWNTTQNPHIVRFIMSVVTGMPEDKLRVIAPEVGGGFGSKIAAVSRATSSRCSARCKLGGR